MIRHSHCRGVPPGPSTATGEARAANLPILILTGCAVAMACLGCFS